MPPTMMPKMTPDMGNYHYPTGYMMPPNAKRPEMMFPPGYCMAQVPQFAPEQFPYYPESSISASDDAPTVLPSTSVHDAASTAGISLI